MILKILIYFRLYPHVFFRPDPFKQYEFKELLRGISFSRDEVILDLGCGIGLQTLLIGKRCKKVIGIDTSDEFIRRAQYISQFTKGRINSQFWCIRIEDAQFENEYFDKIFCFSVFEHISNYLEVLTEAYRILKKDGHMIFSTDSLETIRNEEILEKHRREHFVKKYFGKEELKTILEGVGFKQIDIYPIFKSDFAKELFIKGINSQFIYGFLSSIFKYLFLKYKEYQCTNENKGIFLVVKAKK